jgi:hypothetical protein
MIDSVNVYNNMSLDGAGSSLWGKYVKREYGE